MTGNLVGIEDGCATVTSYKLPEPLAYAGKGERGWRLEVRIPI
jgi:hypothetical protein